MKIILLGIFILNTLLYSNKVYDISKDDYNQYKNNPEKMINIFKNKFLKKVKKVVKRKNNIQKITTNIKKPIIKKEIRVKKESKIKVKHYYMYNEVKNKLDYNNIIKESNINMLLKSINKILEKSKNRYNLDEIGLIIKKIHNKRISKFESEIYLKQIKKLLRDEI